MNLRQRTKKILRMEQLAKGKSCLLETKNIKEILALVQGKRVREGHH